MVGQVRTGSTREKKEKGYNRYTNILVTLYCNNIMENEFEGVLNKIDSDI